MCCWMSEAWKEKHITSMLIVHFKEGDHSPEGISLFAKLFGEWRMHKIGGNHFKIRIYQRERIYMAFPPNLLVVSPWH